MDSHAIYSVISLAGLNLLLFELFRRQAVDRLRQEMFIVRDQLFDDAARGLVDFNHPAYGYLRTTMNGFIRFAHRLSIWHILFTFLLARKNGMKQVREHNNRWQEMTRGLTDKQVEQLAAYRRRMNRIVIGHFYRSFPECLVVWPVSIITMLYLLLYALGKGNPKGAFTVARTEAENRFSENSTGLDEIALAYGG